MESYLDNLKRKILSYTQVEERFLENQLQQYTPFQLKKGETLTVPGKKVEHFYYMVYGCICYYTMDEGEAKVLEFYTEDVFFTDLHAYGNEIPSHYYLKAVEPTLVFGIQKQNAEDLFSPSHQLERFGSLSMQEAFLKLFTRVERMSIRSNEERYLRLLEKRPDLFRRVPNYLIASYLGMTPVGLSKLRKRLSASAS